MNMEQTEQSAGSTEKTAASAEQAATGTDQIAPSKGIEASEPDQPEKATAGWITALQIVVGMAIFIGLAIFSASHHPHVPVQH